MACEVSQEKGKEFLTNRQPLRFRYKETIAPAHPRLQPGPVGVASGRGKRVVQQAVKISHTGWRWSVTEKGMAAGQGGWGRPIS